jgi:hypothetical protein
LLFAGCRCGRSAAVQTGVVQRMLPEQAEQSAHFQQFRIIEGAWFGSLEQQGAS